MTNFAYFCMLQGLYTQVKFDNCQKLSKYMHTFVLQNNKNKKE